jgi:hypothetical protein
MWGTLAECERYWLDEHTAPPMARLAQSLNNKEYADCVFAATSLHILCLTTSPSYQQAREHGSITINFDELSGLFHITYGGKDITDSAIYRCHESQVDSLIDALAFRLLRASDAA